MEENGFLDLKTHTHTQANKCFLKHRTKCDFCYWLTVKTHQRSAKADNHWKAGMKTLLNICIAVIKNDYDYCIVHQSFTLAQVLVYMTQTPRTLACARCHCVMAVLA